MSHADARLLRSFGAILGAALIAGCGTAPSLPPQSPAPAGAGETPGPPLVLEHVADSPILHGDAVAASALVALPGGGFLLYKQADIAGGGALLRSTDGRAWDAVDARASGLDVGTIVAMAATASTVMVLATLQPPVENDAGTPERAEWTSADGIAWSRVPQPAFLAFGTRDIVGSAKGFAALGDPPRTVLISGLDGRHWQTTELPIAPGVRASLNQVTEAGDGFLAVGTVEGRSAAWRWAGTAWLPVRLPATDEISRIVVSHGRIVVTGSNEAADPSDPTIIVLTAIAWESVDLGATWADAGLTIEGGADLRVFAFAGGFLAVLAPSPAAASATLTAWRSTRPDTWDPVSLADAGTGWDLPLASGVAVSGHRVVLAGNTVGTGGGGDRVVVWVGDLVAP